MQFISSLFGGSGQTILTMLFALGAVIVLILLAVWLLKFIMQASGNSVRGRNRRLSVVDTLAVDGKRQVVIVRRDNVEHLIMVGGPQDLVIEAGVPVAEEPAAQPSRRPVPSLAARRPAPVAPTPPAPAVKAETPSAPPVAPVGPAAPGTLLEQLQQAGMPADRKARVSLRHTGLLKPVRNPEPQLDGHNSDMVAMRTDDSAKEVGSTRGNEGSALGHDISNEANRN